MSRKIRIVIVNYNGANFVASAVESALLQTADCEVVVVDNASTDASCEILRTFDTVKLIANDCNVGFGAAANIGAFTKTDNEPEYVAFLNPDAYADARWVERTTLWMAHNAISVGSSVVAGAGRPFFAGGRWVPLVGAALTRFSHEGETTDWVSGCAMIVSADALLSLGGFDPRYFLYFEDVDLSLRARGMNLRLGVLGEMLVTHANDGASTNQLGVKRKAALAFFSKGKLLRRFLNPLQYVIAVPLQIVLSPAMNGVPIRAWPSSVRALLSGLLTG